VVANLVATIGMREGWGADFARAAYRRWFQLGARDRQRAQRIGELARYRTDPMRVLALASSEEAKAALAAETDAAENWEFSVHQHSQWIGSFLGRRQVGGCN